MSTIGTHDPRAVFVMFDGLRLEGFTADGIVTPERLQEAETETGSDGAVVVTRPAAKGEIVTLTFFPHSTGYRILADIFAEEEARVGALPVHEYHQENAVTGDIMSDPNAILIQGPVLNEAQGAGAREFKILLPKPKKRLAQNITV